MSGTDGRTDSDFMTRDLDLFIVCVPGACYFMGDDIITNTE